MVWAEGHFIKNGAYKIVEKIGKGGFGLTYKAIATATQEIVVIKIPREDLRNELDYQKYFDSFAKETVTLDSLKHHNHQHIVRIREQFHEYGLPCLVMDFIDEMNLEETVEQMGALGLYEAVQIIQQIGSALTLVHQLGTVHRDVNPSNIMLPKRGQAILIDFGIVGELNKTSKTSTIFGNSGYAAPEQQNGAKTARVDVYALSGCLYFALTGKPPQWADEDKTEVESPRLHNSMIPTEIESVIMQGLEYRPKDRPESIQAWLTLLPSVKELQHIEKQRTTKLQSNIRYEMADDVVRSVSFRQGLKDYFQLVSRLAKRLGKSFIISLKEFIRLLRGVIEESKLQPRKNIEWRSPDKIHAQPSSQQKQINQDQPQQPTKQKSPPQTISQQISQDADQYFNKGLQLYSSGKYIEAIHCYDKALQIESNDYLIWFNHGIALFALGRDKETIASYDRALQINPDDHEIWFNRGTVLIGLGRNQEALTSYDKALQIKADYHQAWCGKGFTLEILERYQEAINSYDNALQINPTIYTAWNSRGGVLHQLEHYEEAVASYDEALQIKPNKHETWYNRGIALNKLGRYEEAIISYDKAIQIHPDNDIVWNSRGSALYELGRYKEAHTSYDKAMRIKLAQQRSIVDKRKINN